MIPRPLALPPVVVPMPHVPRPKMIPASQAPHPITIPREFLNKVTGGTAAASAFILCAIILGVLFVSIIVPLAYQPSPGVGGVVVPLAAFSVICTFVFGGLWLLLETKHQAAMRRANAERNARLDAIDRENASRQEAYEIAVQVANAKRDAIIDKHEREKRQQEAAYEAAVRHANAERNGVLAAMSLERARRQEAYEAARNALETAEREWTEAADAYQQAFDGQKKGLEHLKSDYLNLKPQYDQEYRELERNKEAAQRDLFLQTQFISDHDIPGIGATREAVLRSNGVETAYDVSQE